MGYVIKKGTGGGGGGDATAANQSTQIANQVIQISQLESGSGIALLKDDTGESVFKVGSSGNQVSLLSLNVSNITGSGTTKCVGFSEPNVNALAGAIQSFLVNACYINNICYAHTGSSHSAIVTYTQIP